jgi:hypothetical protein
MRKRLFLLVFVLTACGTGVGTPKPEPLQLEPLLIQDGDLPAGYTAGIISDGSVGPASGTSGFVNRVMREIQAAGGTATSYSYVAVALYTDKAVLDRDFGTVLPLVQTDGIAARDVGDRARVQGNIVLFTRCMALVQLQVGTPTEALAYAKRLDQRLQSKVC